MKPQHQRPLNGTHMRGRKSRGAGFTVRTRSPTMKVAPATSWWTQGAQPDQREVFAELAKARTIERERAESILQGRKDFAMRHILAPKLYPPIKAER